MDDFTDEVGVNEQEITETIAAPAEKIDTQENEPPEEAAEVRPIQSAEENARYAAARRQAEAQAQQASRERDSLVQRMNAMARARGYDDYTQLEEAVRTEEAQRKNEEYKEKYGFDPNAVKPLVDKAVREHPDVLAARKVAEAARFDEGRRVIDAAICEIGKLDPAIKSIADLNKMDNFETFDRLVCERNYGLVDAYKLANFDNLQQKRAAAVKQAALNSVNGRSHLKDTSGAQGAGAVIVPPDVLEQYRAFNPDATDAEIKNHWAKNR